jgi:hypothetical protein
MRPTPKARYLTLSSAPWVARVVLWQIRGDQMDQARFTDLTILLVKQRRDELEAGGLDNPRGG